MLFDIDVLVFGIENLIDPAQLARPSSRNTLSPVLARAMAQVPGIVLLEHVLSGGIRRCAAGLRRVRHGGNLPDGSMVLQMPGVVLFEQILSAGDGGDRRCRCTGRLFAARMILDMPGVLVFERILAARQSERGKAKAGYGQHCQCTHDVLAF